MNNFKRFLPKLTILFFYIFLGALFFYMPKIYELFRTEDKSINVYTYADFISPESVQLFEEQTGIKVRLKYFDNDNELLAKFKVDKGKGYDVITATGFVINALIKENLLKKIDVSKIPNYKYLNPRLLNKYFDPNNVYTLPYFWSTHGIVYDKNVVKTPPNEISWDLIFKDPASQLVKGSPSKILMLDTSLEIFQIAAVYLFAETSSAETRSVETESLTPAQLEQIKQLLIEQKDWVDVYMTGSLQYYLLSGVTNIAVTYTAFAKKMFEVSDQYNFVIPKEGSIMTIDSFAIPKQSNKSEMATQFINFLISKDIFVVNSEEYGYLPSNVQAYDEVKKLFPKSQNFFPDEKTFKKLHLQHEVADSKEIEKIWLSVRLA